MLAHKHPNALHGKAEDADLRGFCDRIREYERRYDDEGILEYIKAQGIRHKAKGKRLRERL